MWVEIGECKTSAGSKPKDSNPSKMRSPAPSRTGAMSSVSSSITPACSACRTFGAPPADPFLVPVPADGTEHVPPHHIRAPRAHEPPGRDLVRFGRPRVADV